MGTVFPKHYLDYLPNAIQFIALEGTYKHKIMFFGLPLLTSMIILFFALEYASRKTKHITYATLRQEHFFGTTLYLA